jgi:hypothetical protein
MKKFLQILTVSLIVSGGTMCFSNAQDLVRFYENAKVGYKDQDGKVIVPAKYVAGSEFFEGMALVLEGRMRGFINNKGEVAIPFVYNDASVFKGGVARVMKGSKNGYINQKG